MLVFPLPRNPVKTVMGIGDVAVIQQGSKVFGQIDRLKVDRQYPKQGRGLC